MKNAVLSVMIICLLAGACKSKKSTETSTVNTAVKETPAPEKTTGKISHRFRSTGCATVIVVEIKGEADSLILIPRDELPAGLDVNGLEVSFNYRSLRMPQPPGCNTGIPAEITDLERR